MYIQKIRKVFIILMILLIILLYLQFGRDMDVYNSYVFSVGYYHEQQLKVVINKIWVNDNRKCANDILQRCKANSFKSIDFVICGCIFIGYIYQNRTSSFFVFLFTRGCKIRI